MNSNYNISGEYIICEFCKCVLNKNKKSIRKHLGKVHNILPFNKIQQFNDSIEINDLFIDLNDWIGYCQNINKQKPKNSPRQKNVVNLIIKEQELKKLGEFQVQFILIEKELKKISNLYFIGETHSILIRNLQDMIDQLITFRFCKRDSQSLLNKIEQVIDFLKSRPNKIDFLKNECKTLLVTWDDIKFSKNELLISPNKAFVQPIKIEGSLKILNEIKVEYFQRIYKKDIYKLVFHNGYIIEEFSKDLKKIKDLIEHHTNENNFSVKRQKKVIPMLHPKVYDREKILEYIVQENIKNQFIKLPAQKMNDKDHVIALQENNNLVLEECLLFVFKRSDKILFLWENINPNRAGYLFATKIFDYQNNHQKIVEFITSEIKNKRETLFLGVNLNKTYEFDCQSYYQFNHEDVQTYSQKLDIVLNQFNT